MKLLKTLLITIPITVSAHAAQDHYFHEAEQIQTNFVIQKRIQSKNIEDLYRGHKKIVLTIDDGPTSRATPKVLDVLDKHNVKATFFVIGSQVENNRKIMERMQASGHIIGNHSYSHKLIGKMSWLRFKKKVLSEFNGAHNVILPYLNNDHGLYYRAPGASWSAKAAKHVNTTEIGKDYIGPLLWDIGGEIRKTSDGTITHAADWACWNNGWTVNECLEGYVARTERVKGGVVLLHDINAKSAELLDKLITELKQRGYEFITLDDLDLKK